MYVGLAVGGSIECLIRQEAGKTRFIIRNDCEPLSEEVLSKVWDTFYRADNARTRGGTGLGLAIVKNIILLHGGSLNVRNTDTGVEFSFML